MNGLFSGRAGSEKGLIHLVWCLMLGHTEHVLLSHLRGPSLEPIEPKACQLLSHLYQLVHTVHANVRSVLRLRISQMLDSGLVPLMLLAMSETNSFHCCVERDFELIALEQGRGQ